MSRTSAHTSPWVIGEVIFGVPFLAGVVVDLVSSLSLPRGAWTLVFGLVGVALVVAGVVLVVLARRELARFAQPTDPGQPTTRIITTGIFGFSRNPMYLGAGCVLLGIALAFNLPWAVLSLIPALILCQVMLIAPEERYLAATFGDAYTRYAASVWRWLGRTV